MVVGFVGVERIVGFMGVEFLVVHVVVDAHVLTKSAYSAKIRSSQFCLLRFAFDPWAQGVPCPSR